MDPTEARFAAGLLPPSPRASANAPAPAAQASTIAVATTTRRLRWCRLAWSITAAMVLV
jgi:hypothetical protein